MSTVYTDHEKTRYTLHHQPEGYAISVSPVNKPMYLISNTNDTTRETVQIILDEIAKAWGLKKPFENEGVGV